MRTPLCRRSFPGHLLPLSRESPRPFIEHLLYARDCVSTCCVCPSDFTPPCEVCADSSLRMRFRHRHVAVPASQPAPGWIQTQACSAPDPVLQPCGHWGHISGGELFHPEGPRLSVGCNRVPCLQLAGAGSHAGAQSPRGESAHSWGSPGERTDFSISEQQPFPSGRG